MRIKHTLLAVLFLALTQSAFAQLQPWTDYEVSDELWNITMVKVDPNMGDFYLEGLRDTWIAANKVAKELGQIEDYAIYRSQLPNSGDVNVFLVVKFSNSDQLDPNKEEYEKFMEAWGAANQEKTQEISSNYPSMREITGQVLARKIDVK